MFLFDYTDDLLIKEIDINYQILGTYFVLHNERIRKDSLLHHCIDTLDLLEVRKNRIVESINHQVDEIGKKN